MAWLKVGVFVLIAAMALVFVLAMTKPDTFRVQRTVRIQAAHDKVFSFINDFHNWGAWSPYEKLDPAMQRIFSGAPSGVGAVYEWSSAGKAGAGRMEITEPAVATRIGIKLDFFKPFEAHNTAEFLVVPQGDATEVTWAMFGPAPFLSKVMQVFFNLDNMIGRDFEVGLQNLKSVAEK
ncbi:SRPBCC family protein [Uliginosibacterium sp. H3]|uniref:SRPBCC family protein n=1 Tax=Uliginosibacterium silvisoli TaxID=3114758 RepID=A0ABU6K8V1_9RHOO|nr:SRPBCC family protein [Uliginosibacterium sp. H3]